MFPIYAMTMGGAAVAAAPTLASLNYAQADIAGGGQSLVATGTNCAGVTAVNVWGTTVTPSSTTATTVTFAAPAHASGTTTVSLTSPGGTSGTIAFESWSPGQITGVDAYLDSNKGVTASAGAVGTWVAQDAGAKSFSQAVAVNKPTQVASVFGALPSIRLSSTPTQWVRMAAVQVLASGLSWFFVAKYTSTRAVVTSTNNVPLTVFGNSTGGVYNASGASNGNLGYQQYIAGNNQYAAGSGLNDGNARLLGWTHDTGGNLKGYVGATLQGAGFTGVTYQTGFDGYDTIGAGYTDVDGFAGDLGAVISVSGIISAGDLTKLNAWAQQRFGTP